MDYDWLYAEIGRRVLRERRRAGLTQEDLARRVDLTRTSITNIERGRQKIQVHTLYAIAEALDVRSTALLPGDGSKVARVAEEVEEYIPEGLPPSAREWVKRVVTKEGR